MTDPVAGMAAAEAEELLQNKATALRRLPYAELRQQVPRSRRFLIVSFYKTETCVEEVTGPSGSRYELETHVFWDDKPGGDIRVLIECFDLEQRRWRRTDFIKAPDDTFVGE